MLFGTCVCQQSQMTSINYFPVRRLFTFFLSVPTETIVCSFRIKTEDLSLFVDPEGESGNWCTYEESEIIKETKKQCTLHHWHVTFTGHIMHSHPDLFVKFEYIGMFKRKYLCNATLGFFHFHFYVEIY